METIFDIATPAELIAILGNTPFSGDKMLYDTEHRITNKKPDMGYMWLAELYAMRGDMEQADKYIEAIKDNQTRLDTMLFINHP